MRRPRGSTLRAALGIAVAVAIAPAGRAARSALPPGAWQAAASQGVPVVSCGHALCRPDGTLVRWRGMTAFALADLIADGRHREARAFVAWAAETGFTVLRVLAMNGGWMSLSPQDGRRALPEVLALAREHGLIVQVVALAGTRDVRFSSDTFLRDQVSQVGRLCHAAGNCVLEIANEPYHSSQRHLQDPALMRRLQEEVPSGLLVAWGAADRDESDIMAGGTYVVAHRARSGDRWAGVARVQRLAALAHATGKFVVDNEPIGAGEVNVQSRRDSLPSTFFAQGALARIFDVGSTFHCEDCLRARVPGPTQRRSAEAFIEGTRLVPDAIAPAAFPPGTAGSPVERPDDEKSVGLTFAGVAGSQAWVVRLGPAGRTQPRWLPGWRVVEHVSRWPGAEAWVLAR